MSQKDELQELYNLFHDGPCGQFYQQWEQCVEVVRREGDDENIDQRYVHMHLNFVRVIMNAQSKYFMGFGLCLRQNITQEDLPAIV